MKCKHCGYKHGWDSDTQIDAIGKYGDFYFMKSHGMERSSHYYNKEAEQIYGCPFCGKLFIDICVKEE